MFHVKALQTITFTKAIKHLESTVLTVQVAVATNPTHYGNPSTGCESDEQAVRVQGLSGDFCSPKCDTQGSCPSDVPKGDTATPECALRTTTGDKYCALICQSDSDCGSLAASRMSCHKWLSGEAFPFLCGHVLAFS